MNRLLAEIELPQDVEQLTQEYRVLQQFLHLAPVGLLAYFKVIGATTAIVLAVVGAVVFPMIFYRASRSWWLMNYYFFFPHHLPANGGPGRAGEDDNR